MQKCELAADVKIYTKVTDMLQTIYSSDVRHRGTGMLVPRVICRLHEFWSDERGMLKKK